jgi:hypothetical protein
MGRYHKTMAVSGVCGVGRFRGEEEADDPAGKNHEVGALSRQRLEAGKMGADNLLKFLRSLPDSRCHSDGRARKIGTRIILDGETPVHEHRHQPMGGGGRDVEDLGRVLPPNLSDISEHLDQPQRVVN